ncbi:MAG TPA: hypothetical protein VI076_06225 [Actinopolymorphaceae bacterium]
MTSTSSVISRSEHSAIDADSGRYVTGVDSWEWLSITLAMVGVPYVIEGPPELIDFSRDLARRIARAAGAATTDG